MTCRDTIPLRDALPSTTAPPVVTVPSGLVPGAGPVLATLAPRAYWREGFENPIRGIPNAARVRAAYSGRRALRVGARTARSSGSATAGCA